MVDENPVDRPSASTLIHHPCIVPDASKSKSQLRKELNQEKFKNEMLKRKVEKYEMQLSSNTTSTTSTAKDFSPLVPATRMPIHKNLMNVSSLNSKFSRSTSSTLL